MNNFILICILIIVIILFYNEIFVNEHFGNEYFGNNENKNYLQNIPICAINLEHRNDRLINFKNELNKINVNDSNKNLHIIKAVNGEHLNVAKLKNDGYMNFTFNRAMRAGELGCYFSHLMCWEKILETSHPYGMVLEDDAIFINDFDTIFNKLFMNALNYEWDIFILGRNCIKKHYGNECTKGIIIDQQLWYPEIPGYGTFAYIIKREAIFKIFKSVYPINVPIDVLLIDLSMNKNIKIISVTQNITKQRNFKDSDTMKIN